MAEKSGKPTRVVKEYKRRGYPVRGYVQQYDKPRGNWNQKIYVDPVKKKSATAWVKNSHGKFVGRANSRLQTRAKNVKAYGFDRTRAYREKGKYGRITGRASSS